MVSNFLMSCMLAACATAVDGEPHPGQHATAPSAILAPEGRSSAVQAAVPKGEPIMADLSYGKSALELAAVRAPGGGVPIRGGQRRSKSDSKWRKFVGPCILLSLVACSFASFMYCAQPFSAS
mmetsp:Transcript_48451/g.96378  ORF Transcript_48451/g.96378 Transcript_48451/m.96378 type:complete len:123 (+) Transcript_48451:58-426(+)